MMGNLAPEAGRFGSGNVGVFDGDNLNHAGTPATFVPEVMADIFSWLMNTGTHPLLASCIFHFEFEFCRPFSGGNGRTGRLWHTLLLSKWRPVLAWLPIESTIRQRQAGYYEALVEFMLETMRDSLLPFFKPTNEHDRMKTKVLEFFTRTPRRQHRPVGRPPRMLEENRRKAGGRVEKRRCAAPRGKRACRALGRGQVASWLGVPPPARRKCLGHRLMHALASEIVRKMPRWLLRTMKSGYTSAFEKWPPLHQSARTLSPPEWPRCRHAPQTASSCP